MALSVKDITLTFPQVAKANSVILVGVANDTEYVDGKSTGNRLGTRYSCVAPANKYAAFSVKVKDAAPIITQETLDEAAAPVMVCFDNFQGRFYKLRESNDYAFTATASKAMIVK